MAVYEQVIANLSRQLEDLSVSLDCLRESDQTLRLSLRTAEQKALESEAKLNAAQEKCVPYCVAGKYGGVHMYTLVVCDSGKGGVQRCPHLEVL